MQQAEGGAARAAQSAAWGGCSCQQPAGVCKKRTVLFSNRETHPASEMGVPTSSRWTRAMTTRRRARRRGVGAALSFGYLYFLAISIAISRYFFAFLSASVQCRAQAPLRLPPAERSRARPARDGDARRAARHIRACAVSPSARPPACRASTCTCAR